MIYFQIHPPRPPISHEYPYPEQFNYEGYDQGGAVNGYPSINQTNYGGGLSPFNQDYYPHDIDAFGKGKGKGGKRRQGPRHKVVLCVW